MLGFEHKPLYLWDLIDRKPFDSFIFPIILMENGVVNLPLDSLFQTHLQCEKVSTVTNTVASLCVLPLRLERVPDLSHSL